MQKCFFRLSFILFNYFNSFQYCHASLYIYEFELTFIVVNIIYLVACLSISITFPTIFQYITCQDACLSDHLFTKHHGQPHMIIANQTNSTNLSNRLVMIPCAALRKFTQTGCSPTFPDIEWNWTGWDGLITCDLYVIIKQEYKNT